MSVPDQAFLQAARQLGKPGPAVLQQLVALREAAAKAGPAPDLYDLALEKGLLDPADAARIVELAAAALRPSGRNPAVKHSSELVDIVARAYEKCGQPARAEALRTRKR